VNTAALGPFMSSVGQAPGGTEMVMELYPSNEKTDILFGFGTRKIICASTCTEPRDSSPGKTDMSSASASGTGTAWS
jgi:hypothetical protein